MKEKRLYLPSEKEQFNKLTTARQVEREVIFSDDKRDFAWMKENVPCQAACPALTNIPGYIHTIFQERYGRAYEINRYVNILPGVLGRICSRPCEPVCRHGWPGNGEPVAICHLKRVASDFKPTGHRIEEFMFGPSEKKVAIIGSGPAGLGAAHDLAILGHKVIIYEALEEPGGMLRYGIPMFRLPRNILDPEIENIIRLGVELKTGVCIGKKVAMDELLASHDAVLVTAGTFTANVLNIAGESADHVYSGLQFMINVNSGKNIFVGERVLVIGGGYTAMDCARSAMRLGAKRTIINILTTEDYITVSREELLEVKSEDVEIRGLVSIQSIEKKDGTLSVTFKHNKLGGYAPSGDRIAIPIKGSDFSETADSVIYAIGQRPDTGFFDNVVKLNKKGMVDVDPETSMTAKTGLFVAGDFSSGASTIIAAIASGRTAALNIDKFLMKHTRRKKIVRLEQYKEPLRERNWDFIPKQAMPVLPSKGRVDQKEVELGLDENRGKEEAKRCYLCYLKFEIDPSRCIYCRACIDVCPTNCIKLAEDVQVTREGTSHITVTNKWDKVTAVVIDNKDCIRCGKCYQVCPVQCINIIKTELIEQDIEV